MSHGSSRLWMLGLVILLTSVCRCVAYSFASSYRSAANGAGVGASAMPYSLIRAQCKCTCLRKFYDQYEAILVQGSTAAVGDLHSWCTGDSSCSDCYAGCEAQTADICSIYCLSSSVSAPVAAPAEADSKLCSESCKLVQTMLSSAPTVNTNLPYPRINEPRETYIESMLDGLAVQESALDIEWSLPPLSNMTPPVLFVLDARFCIGPHVDEHCASPWRQITMTTRLGAEMSDVKVGWRYQFRIAAVSSEGTRGFKVTTAVGLQAEPRAPNAPENLTEVRTTLRSNKVDVEIRWDAPKHSDLEVAKYRIFWSKKLDDAPLVMSSKEYSKTTIRSENSYTIEDLDPDAVYSVSVQAISLYGNLELHSKRTTFYVSTLAIASANDTRRNGLSSAQKQLFPVNVNHTFYEEDELKAIITWPLANTKVNILRFHVSWKPLACIGEPPASTKPLGSPPTTYRYAVLNKLNFDCRYEVVVRPMTADDRQLIPSTAIFDTPSCSKVHSRNGKKPKCSDSRPLPAVSSLSCKHIQLSDSAKYAVNVSWRPQVRSLGELFNYRIVWGRDSRQSPSIHKLPFRNLTHLFKDSSSSVSIDKNDAVTKVVPRNTSWLLISELEDNVLYSVVVTAVSTHGDGHKSQLQFYKPFNASLIQLTASGLLGSFDAKGKAGKANSNSKRSDKDNQQIQAQISVAKSHASCLFANALFAFSLSTVAHFSAFAIR